MAAWWVVLYHFRENFPLSDWPLAEAVVDHGYMAVDLFFVLSGFIVGMNYMPGFRIWSVTTYLRFLMLRLGRIYPLHLFMMILFLVNPAAIILLSQTQDPGSRYDASYYGLSLLLLQNWGFSHQLAWNVPAWSISTEWFAYLIFPAVAWIGRLASNRLRAVLGILTALLLLAGAMFTLGDSIPTNGLARCVLEFSAGSLVYIYWTLSSADRCLLSRSATVLWLPLVAAASLFPALGYSLAALAWCVLIFGLANNRNILSKFFSTHLLYQLGQYSYSTYLVHYLLRDWMKFLVLGRGMDWRIETGLYLTATATASVVLYRLVEVPGRNFVRLRVKRGNPTPPPWLPIRGGIRPRSDTL